MPTQTLRNSAIVHTHWDLATLVAELRHSREVTHSIRHKGRVRELPSREVLATIVDALASALFPTHYGTRDLTDESVDYYVGNLLNSALTDLAEQVRRGLLFASGEPEVDDRTLLQRALDITRRFAGELPANCRRSARCWSATCAPPTRAIRPPTATPRSCSAIRGCWRSSTTAWRTPCTRSARPSWRG